MLNGSGLARYPCLVPDFVYSFIKQDSDFRNELYISNIYMYCIIYIYTYYVKMNSLIPMFN